MTVERIHEDPRVTKPYTDRAMGSRFEQLGRKVDARLEHGDVRLTMGGEPTFVSIDDMDGPEWNMAAEGPHKRRLRRQTSSAAWRAVRHRTAVALRPGQVVSRRVAAPLGLGLLLAAGRRADLARPGT